MKLLLIFILISTLSFIFIALSSPEPAVLIFDKWIFYISGASMLFLLEGINK